MAETAALVRRGLVGAAAAALLAAGIWLAVRPAPLPEGPVAVPYGHVRCARCGMLVDEPAYAGQVQARDGEVFYFDDPGCLLLHEADEHEPRHAVYLHHHREERWIRLDDARFVPSPGPTPMGYGLAVVDGDEAPDGLDPARALEWVREREQQRRAR